MGIYISGVKGLPEQVQQNKEDIKTIQEEIEGIDFEQIRQLETQVGENTQDINNLEAAIGVQNQAINGLKDRADALESKTQLITYNSDYGMTDFRNSIEVADDVYASNVRVIGDGSIVNTSQSGMHFKEGANDDTLTIANNDGATPHYLHFNADGTLDIDGGPVGAKPLYQHNIRITSSPSTKTFTIFISIVCDIPNVFNRATLKTYMNGKGRFVATGLLYDSSTSTNSTIVYLQDTPGVLITVGFIDTSANTVSEDSINANASSINDTVVQIA